MTTARYDRQIRLWGEEGQTSIQQTSVCVLGSSVVAAETLKNLVLAGIQSFQIVDDAIVNETDLGKNFFVSAEGLGKPRAEVVTVYLKELNNNVAGDFVVSSPLKYPMEKLLDYSIVISTILTRAELMPIAEFLYEKGVPLIDTRVYGLTGYFRHSFKLHTIYHTHNEHPQPDLRLDQPFESLLKMNKENDLSKMDHERHSHTPYALVVLQALEIWRQKIGDLKAFPENYKQRKEIGEILLEMRMPDKNGVLDEDNFAEAKNSLNRILMKTTIPENVRQVFEHELCKVENLTPETCNWFWILAAALKGFVDKHGVLPISGQLPDMTSDSARYAKLLNLYRNEAEKHAKEVHEMALIIIEHVYGSRSYDMIPFEQTKKFCKQAAFIGVQKGSSLKQESDQGISPILPRITDPEPAVPSTSPMRVCPLTWLILIKATDNFYNGKKRFPGTNGVPQHIDAEDLARRVEQLFNDTKNAELVSKAKTLIPIEVVNEICRYGASEPHVIASILGGIVSQEAIKLATHQYVPVDNTFIYDGHKQSAETIRL